MHLDCECDNRDVQVMRAADTKNPSVFARPWLVLYACGKIGEYDTEDHACQVQRNWRIEHGWDAYRGPR